MTRGLQAGSMRRMPALALLAIGATLAGCGSSSSSSSTAGASKPSSTSAAGGVNPNAKETLPPGDIPDTVSYPRYPVPGAGISVRVPEGWSRTNASNGVSFTDKLNTVSLVIGPANGPVAVASVKSTEVPKLAGSVKGFNLQGVSLVSRQSGPAVRVAYLGDSPPVAVTGKVGVLAFERYYFTHGQREVILTLSAPNGSDNVDPWRKVTDSLRFTR